MKMVVRKDAKRFKYDPPPKNLWVILREKRPLCASSSPIRTYFVFERRTIMVAYGLDLVNRKSFCIAQGKEAESSTYEIIQTLLR